MIPEPRNFSRVAERCRCRNAWQLTFQPDWRNPYGLHLLFSPRCGRLQVEYDAQIAHYAARLWFTRHRNDLSAAMPGPIDHEARLRCLD